MPRLIQQTQASKGSALANSRHALVRSVEHHQGPPLLDAPGQRHHVILAPEAASGMGQAWGQVAKGWAGAPAAGTCAGPHRISWATGKAWAESRGGGVGWHGRLPGHQAGLVEREDAVRCAAAVRQHRPRLCARVERVGAGAGAHSQVQCPFHGWRRSCPAVFLLRKQPLAIPQPPT